MTTEKRVSYQATASYATLNEIGPKTKNIWLVFHGMGYLSRYFLRYFKDLSAEENYIIAPQAPSKYYSDPHFKYVGASWLTRVDTKEETRNVLAYVDSVWKAEKPEPGYRLIVLGYSQGVSIATRWLAERKIECNYLILHSGAVPKELVPSDFDFLSDDSRVTYLYGTNDEYIDEARKTEESLRGKGLFGGKLEIEIFKGIHEVNTEFLQQVAISVK